jgi:serine/threonine protein kinase
MGFSLKDFKHIEKVGEGGQGKIYRAVQTSLQRRVIIKEMAGGLLESEEQLQWLQEEAATAASLEHDNIVRIYDFGSDRGSFYLVMEYIEGLDFARLLTLEKFPKEMGLMIILLALRGLHYAHSKGIVHCDFKPNNILVSRTGRVTVTDFGMAYPDPKSVRLTTKGKIFLTPAFMPPEVAVEIEGQGRVKELFSETSPVAAAAEAAERLKKPDIRRDIWSTGVILFRILTGRFPFTGENIPQLIASILLTEVPSMETMGPSLPLSLTGAIGACLEKRPEKRLSTLGPLIEPLEKFFLDLNIPDFEKEICTFFADAGAVVRRMEQKLLVYHNREWRACKRAGNAAQAIVHLQEAERYASIVLSAAGVSTGPLIPPPPALRRRLKPKALFAPAAALIAAAAMLLLLGISGGVIKHLLRPEPPVIAAAVPESTPADERQGTAASGVTPAADAGESTPDTTFPHSNDTQSAPTATAVLPSAPAKRRTSAGAPSPSYGRLMVTITPAGAQVFADERQFSAGDGDSGTLLPTGTHFITATADGFEPYWGSLDIAENQTSMLSIRLVPLPESHGYLQLSVSPPATMYIDGVFRGAGRTAAAIALKAGEHYVTLRCRGRKTFERPVTIDSGGTAVIETTLEPIVK